MVRRSRHSGEEVKAYRTGITGSTFQDVVQTTKPYCVIFLLDSQDQ